MFKRQPTEPSPDSPGSPRFSLPKLTRPTRKAATHRHGVTIDGSCVHAVELIDGEVTSYQTYRAGSSAEALAQWRSATKVGNTPVTIAWVDPGTYARTIDVPNVPDAAVGAALQTVASEVMPVDMANCLLTYTKPARTHDDSGSGDDGVLRGKVCLVAVERQPLEGLFDLAADLGAEILAEELCLTRDGLYLAVHHSTATVSLVHHGTLAVSRHLRCGGLDAVVADLDGSGGEGLGRFTNAMRGLAGDDMAASARIDTYLNDLTDELRTTTAYWERNGLVVGGVVYVYGPGAELPGLAGRLFESALTADAPPLPAATAMAGVPTSQRFAAYSPMLAAGTALDDHHLYVENQTLVEASVARRKSATRRRIITGAALVVAAVAVLVLGPLAYARYELWSVQSQRNDIAAELEASADALAVGQYAQEAQANWNMSVTGEMDWGTILPQVLAMLPPDAVIESLEFRFASCPDPTGLTAADSMGSESPVASIGQCISFTVGASLPNTGFTPVTQWLRGIEDAGGVGVWVENLSPGDLEGGTQLVLVDFSLPVNEAMFVVRPAPGQPSENIEVTP